MPHHDDNSTVTSSTIVPDLSALHVLVADDDEINQLVARSLLEDAGAKVSIVSNGIEAVEAVCNARFDIVLMDVQMPGMDGIEATLKIRDEYTPAELPIIAMSANITSDDRQRCLAAGMNDFVAKPVDAGLLFEVLWAYAREAVHYARQGIMSTGSQAGAAHSFDPGQALKRVGNKGDFDSMLGIFVMSYGHDTSSVRNALTGPDWQEVASYAHRLKGSSAIIGAPVLAGLARQLEEAVAVGEIGKTARLAADIEVELARVIASIEAYLQTGNVKSGQAR